MDLYNSLFGTGAPQLEFGGVITELNHVIIIKDEADSDDIMHESVINRHREWDRLGKHWIFIININLFEYGNDIARQAMYDKMIGLKRRLVKLWRRRDGEYFQNVSSNVVYFRVHRVIPMYYETPDKEDILQVAFISQDPIDITKTLKVEES